MAPKELGRVPEIYLSVFLIRTASDKEGWHSRDVRSIKWIEKGRRSD